MRLASGIPGFDEMIQGGIPAGTSTVLQGPPGQEKLRFSLTFLAEGLKAGGSGLVVVASQSPDMILTELRGLGVDLDKVVQENRLRIVDWYSQREEPVQDVEDRGTIIRSSIDLTNVGVALSRAIASLGGDVPKRAVVELLSPATSVYEIGQVYAFAQSSKGKFVRFNYTALFLVEKEMHAGAELSTLHQPFDGVVEIERARIGDRIVRKIGVLHMKDTSPESAFRVLETAPEGLRVVREEGPPSSGARIAPPRSGPDPSSPGARSVVAETPGESPTRAHLIMQIARERLKLNPGDADALFAMAAAQATIDDARGALESLERLAKISDRYPGLWVLKTKLHARLGEIDRARESRVRAEQAAEWEGEELFVPCPLCDAPVAEGASRCPRCGAAFLTDTKITDELDALGHAAIQERVQQEIGPDVLAPSAERPKGESRVPPKPVPSPSGPAKIAEKSGGRKGFTNGSVRERTPGRAVGMTNGLRGRTNGLTNGLRGRTNGLTNGLRGRTNGLTNGLRGRTNGLTNGMGRTNGLTNGLVSLRRGITNGLTNGNGFTNGLGSPRFRREIRLSRWKLYVIPIVAFGLLVLPFFAPHDYDAQTRPIQIDGQFGDWSTVAKLDFPTDAGIPPGVDIVRVALEDNLDYLAFYIEARGPVFEGSPLPDRITDTVFVFLDLDRSVATGYQVQALGADRLIEVSGWGRTVARATLYEFDGNRDARDWHGWFKATPIAAAASGTGIELEVDWDYLVIPKAPIDAAVAARAWDGKGDVAHATVPSSRPYVVVTHDTAAPLVATGPSTTIASLGFQAVGGDAVLQGVNLTLTGTFSPGSVGGISLHDDSGALLAQASVLGSRLSLDLPSVLLPQGTTVSVTVRASVGVADGTTVGAFVSAPRDVRSAGAGVSLVAPIRGPATLSYVGSIPAGVRVDGGFAEWSNLTFDPAGDDALGWVRDVDLSAYGFQGYAGSTFFYARTVGSVLNGTLIPAPNAHAPDIPPTGPDSDRDGVPDSADVYPYDFNNDGIPDAASGGDYDGDGSVDYGFPGGTDYWLNTTIPGTFPPPYAGRLVSVYIGPVDRPPVRGDDTVRFFLDSDGSESTGYAISGIGADYLVEITGKAGAILTSVAMQFTGATPGVWSWDVLGPSAAASDRTRLEAALAGVVTGNASKTVVTIDGWASRDMTVAAGPSFVPSGPAVLYVPGPDGALDPTGIIDTSTSASSVGGPFARNIIYDGTNYWAFYYDGSTIVYEPSSDGLSWVNTRANAFTTATIITVSVWFHDTGSSKIVYIAGDTSANSKTANVRRGTISGTTITWGTEAQVTMSNNNHAKKPFITRDSSGYLWVVSNNREGASAYNFAAVRSTNVDDVSAWGAYTNLLTASLSSSSIQGLIVPLGSGEVYAAWYADGAIDGKRYSGSWGSLETIDTTSTGSLTRGPSAVVDGSFNIHLVFADSSGVVKYRQRTTSWSAPTTLDAASGSTSPTISRDGNTGDLYAFWISSTNQIKSSKYAGSWSSVTLETNTRAKSALSAIYSSTTSTQFARPDADLNTGTWTPTPIWDQLDDNSDVDFVTATSTGSNDVSLTDIADPLDDANHIIRFRARATGSGGPEQLGIQLYQGSTLIASTTQSITRSSFNTYTYTLTTGQAAVITDYGDLRFRLVASTLGGGESLDLSWAELQVPAAPAMAWVWSQGSASPYDVKASVLTTSTRSRTIDTSTDSSPLSFNHQRKVFHAEGRWWAFYYDGANTVYTHSEDGLTWENSVTQAFATSAVDNPSVWFHDTGTTRIVYIVGDTSGNDNSVVVRRGTISGSTITWGSEATVTVGSFSVGTKIAFITRDTNGKLWVVSNGKATSSNFDVFAAQSTNADDVSAWQSATQLLTATTSVNQLYPSIVPQSGGNMYAFWYNDGAIDGKRYTGTWGSLESIATTSAGVTTKLPSAVVDGSDNIHLAYIDTAGAVLYRQRTTSWGSATTLDSASGSTSPTITRETGTGDLYVFYIASSGQIKGKRYAGSWTDVGGIDVSTTTKAFITSPYTVPALWRLAWLWGQGGASPYEVKIAQIPEFGEVIVPVAGAALMVIWWGRRRARRIGGKRDAMGAAEGLGRRAGVVPRQ